MPETAVVMPIRGDAPYLADALRSLAAQTSRDWILVVVLDGPAPGAAEALSRFTGPLVVHERPALGIAAALNWAVEHSDSELVARLDSDDVCAPVRIHQQAEHLREAPSLGAVTSGAYVIDSSSQVVGRRRGPASVQTVRAELLVRNTLIHSATTLRRSTMARIGPFGSGMDGYEDYEYWLRLLVESRIGLSPHPLLYYRLHPDQFSRSLTITPAAAEALRCARLRLCASMRLPAPVGALAHRAWLRNLQIDGQAITPSPATRPDGDTAPPPV